jgi:hypothetical protein
MNIEAAVRPCDRLENDLEGQILAASGEVALTRFFHNAENLKQP